jgi:sugar/nucleoside kinase (ribokinase family)
MVTHPGAMELFGQNDLSPTLFDDFNHLHLSSIFFQPQLKKDLPSILQTAKKAGLTTSMDVQWDPEEKWNLDLKAVLSNLDFFMPNEKELVNLMGTDSLDNALRALTEFDTKFVIKRGKNGSIYQHKGMRLSQKAFILSNLADAIGAGDSFNAGFIRAFLNQKTPEECLQQGSITAAVSTLEYGGTGAIKSYQQVQNYLNQKS